MRILVTGATSKIGVAVIQKLLSEQHTRKCQVTALVRNSSDEKYLRTLPINIIHGDLTIPDTIRGCCIGIDSIIHTVGFGRNAIDVTPLDIDYNATVNLLNEAKTCNVKHISYISMIGAGKDSKISVLNIKSKTEEIIRNAQIPFTIYRISCFLSEILNWAYNIRKSNLAVIINNGKSSIAPISEEDLAYYLVESCHSYLLKHKIVEVGLSRSYSWKTILDIISSCSEKNPIKINLSIDVFRFINNVLSGFNKTKQFRLQYIEYLLTNDNIPKINPITTHFTKYNWIQLDQYIKENLTNN